MNTMTTLNQHGSGLAPSIEKQVQTIAARLYNKLGGRGLDVGGLMEDLISKLEIDVLYYDFNQPGVEGKTIHGIYLRSQESEQRRHKIVVNANDDEKTQNFTLAHELFHHLLMEDQSSKLAQLLTNEEWLERAGDYFAACFLMNSEKFKKTYNFLRKQNSDAELIWKLSDAFITPYESVVRRLVELELLSEEDSHLLDLKEEDYAKMRTENLGPSVLDAPSQKSVFQPYVNIIVKRLENGDLTYMEAIKRLNRVNPKKAQEIQEKHQKKMDEWDDDED